MLKPWQSHQWVISELNAGFLAQMELVLDVYAQGYDPNYPVVCIDETPGEILESEKEPMQMRPGRPTRQDYIFHRTNRYTLFMAVEPLGGWRLVDVRQQGTGCDFAELLVQLAEHYPDAEQITVVLDNLSTHKLKFLWEILPADEALEIARRFNFVKTPVHGSWLNMAEIELAAFKKQCQGSRRFEKLSEVRSEAIAWAQRRNELKVTIDWGFTVDDSRDRFRTHYERELSVE